MANIFDDALRRGVDLEESYSKLMRELRRVQASKEGIERAVEAISVELREFEKIGERLRGTEPRTGEMIKPAELGELAKERKREVIKQLQTIISNDGTLSLNVDMTPFYP